MSSTRWRRPTSRARDGRPAVPRPAHEAARAHVPIISLGSGPHAHGQLLIFHDMFGLYPRFKTKMSKIFANAGEVILNGLKQSVAEVTSLQFPQPENWFGIKDDEYAELVKMIGK